MVNVLPQSQLSEDGISFINHAVAVSAKRPFVEHGQRLETDRRISWQTLRRDVAEQFRSVIDLPVLIPIKHEPGIGRSAIRPGDSARFAVSEEVKHHAV